MKKKLVKKLRADTKRLLCIAKQQNLLITALFSWVVFLVYEVTIRTYDLYRTLPDVDLGGHFLAGIALAASFYWLAIRKDIARPYWLIFIGTFVASFLWEIAEIMQEWFFYNPPHLIDGFLWDGIIDIIVALVAAITFMLIKRR